MEAIIYKELTIKNIVFYQEVTFKNCRNPRTGMLLRYDFYIPSKNLLIEYDGKEFHQDTETVYRDSIKDAFAKKNNIKLVRLCGKKSIIDLINTIDNYGKRPQKKNKPYKNKPIVDPIERYKQGLQEPILSQVEKEKAKREKVKRKKAEGLKRPKKEARVSDWKPVPYKRIIIV